MRAYWLEQVDGRTGAISKEQLRDNAVLYEQLDIEATRFRQPLDAFKRSRGYVQEDVVELSPDTPGLSEISRKFVEEHYHDEDEVRFVLEGEGIFDIRSRDDAWMRVVVEPGDLIVVPGRRHHRFMLTEAQRIRCVRLFQDQSGWVPHYRS